MPPDPGDLGDLLRQEHRAISDLLDALVTDRRDRFPLAHLLIDELAAHTAAEQQLFYPALRDVVPGGIEMANRAQAEHKAMRSALAVLERRHPGEPAFEDALASVAAEFRAHVPVEEDEVLPALRAVIGSDKMGELAVLYRQIKDNVPSGLQGLAADLPEPEFRSW
jgi:hypothetical protein